MSVLSLFFSQKSVIYSTCVMDDTANPPTKTPKEAKQQDLWMWAKVSRSLKQ
jgi:hypothetical protein